MLIKELSKRVIEEADIVDVVSEVVSLVPKGSSYFGLCPFHADKNPSMSVSREKKIFNCFSCGTKGNVISFYAKYNNLSYNESTIQLAKKIGIQVDEKLTLQSEKDASLYKAMEEAASFYQFYLMNSIESEEALKYLNNRGITKEIIEKFGIGLAPSAEDDLYVTLKKEKITELDQIELGLIAGNSQGKIYDLFRRRIMFPINDHFGKPVGFSGRIYLPEQNNQPKYVNSKETAIFHKGNLLYNFYNASKSARLEDCFYLFEGFMDVIAAEKAGIYNGVATMGTALTSDHIRSLLSVSNNIILCFDGDEAGIKALKRSLSLFSAVNLVPEAIILPNNLDPDEYLHKYGKDALVKELKINHRNALEVIYQHCFTFLNRNDIISIEKFKNEIFETLGLLKQETLVDYYLKKIAVDLQIDLEIIKNDFTSYLGSHRDYITTVDEINDFPKTIETVIRGIVQDKHYLAIKQIIGQIFRNSKRLDEYKEALGENSAYICTELRLYHDIIFSTEHYYNEKKSEKQDYPTVTLKNLSEVLKIDDKDNPKYSKCVEILNSLEYKLGNNDASIIAFKQNLNCLKQLVNLINKEDAKKKFIASLSNQAGEEFRYNASKTTKILK